MLAFMASTSLFETLSIGIFFAANVGYCIAYTVRNVLWLRVIIVVASLMTLPYYLSQSSPLYSALMWHTVFALINVVNIIQLLESRRVVPLSPEQQILKNMVFRNFTHVETRALLALAKWQEVAAGSLLIRRDHVNRELILVYSGLVQISHDQRVLAVRGPGSLLGELSFATGKLPIAEVRSIDSLIYLSWDHAVLHRYLNKNQTLKNSFNALLTATMASKLESV